MHGWHAWLAHNFRGNLHVVCPALLMACTVYGLHGWPEILFGLLGWLAEFDGLAEWLYRTVACHAWMAVARLHGWPALFDGLAALLDRMGLWRACMAVGCTTVDCMLNYGLHGGVYMGCMAACVTRLNGWPAWLRLGYMAVAGVIVCWRHGRPAWVWLAELWPGWY